MGVVVIVNKDEASVKMLYAAIIRQALDDWKSTEKKINKVRLPETYEDHQKIILYLSRKDEIKRFFNSDWGKSILDVLGIDMKIINDKCHMF